MRKALNIIGTALCVVSSATAKRNCVSKTTFPMNTKKEYVPPASTTAVVFFLLTSIESISSLFRKSFFNALAGSK